MKTHLDLFSGIGGFALAARWAGFTTVAFCEIDPYAQQVIIESFGARFCGQSWPRDIKQDFAQIMADADNNQPPQSQGIKSNKRRRIVNGGQKTMAHTTSPRCGDPENSRADSSDAGTNRGGSEELKRRSPLLWPDIRKLDGTRYRGIDLLTGGFPCQPFSCAGKRRGASDDRALWPEMFRVIAESQPAWCLAENVPGIIGMELDRVLSDLEGIGYETGTLVIPACAVDAPHRRDRVWIVAHAECSKRRPHHERTGCDKERDDGQREAASDVRECGKVLADTGKRAIGVGFCENATIKHGVIPGNESGSLSNSRRELLQGRIGEPEAPATQRQSQSRLGRVDDGLPEGLDGYCQWPEEDPKIPRVSNGIKNRVSRLKGLGNAIVPQLAFQILKHL